MRYYKFDHKTYQHNLDGVLQRVMVINLSRVLQRLYILSLLLVSAKCCATYKEVLLTVCFCHVTYAFQSESTLYSCLNVKELLAQNRREMWSLSECNWTRTHNHLVRKRTLNHLDKLAKWLSRVVGTYLYGVFDCMFLSCHSLCWGRYLSDH